MAWFTPSSRFTPLVLAVALTLGLGVNVPAQVKAQSTPPSLGRVLESAFRAPRTDTPAPNNREGGATRGPCVMTENLVALVPFGVGNTTAEYPTIYWYMPQLIDNEAPSPVVEFVLKDANQQEIYSATYPLAKTAGGIVGTPGLMSVRIASLYPLKVNQEYQWEVVLRCDSKLLNDRSQDMYVVGAIKRVEADPTLAQRLQRATPQERVAIYAKAQLWYEALGTLAELRRDRPNDSGLADAWSKLLDSVELDKISREPLYQGVSNLTSNN